KEVRAMCDRATVLRDGRDMGTLLPAEAGEAAMVDLMLGPAAQEVLDVAESAPAGGAAAPPDTDGPTAARPVDAETSLLEVDDLHLGDELNGVSLAVRPGEIVGVAALEGQG